MPPLRRPNRTGKDRESEPVLSDREVWTVKIRAGALVVFTLPAVPLVSQTVCSESSVANFASSIGSTVATGRWTSINLLAMFGF